VANKTHPVGVTWAQAVRDVLVASINKGQFLVAIVGIIFLVIVVKMPEKDVSKLAFEIVEDLKTLHLLGYALFVVTLGFWYLHAQLMRRVLHGKPFKTHSGGKP